MASCAGSKHSHLVRIKESKSGVCPFCPSIINAGAEEKRQQADSSGKLQMDGKRSSSADASSAKAEPLECPPCAAASGVASLEDAPEPVGLGGGGRSCAGTLTSWFLYFVTCDHMLSQSLTVRHTKLPLPVDWSADDTPGRGRGSADARAFASLQGIATIVQFAMMETAAADARARGDSCSLPASMRPLLPEFVPAKRRDLVSLVSCALDAFAANPPRQNTTVCRCDHHCM